MKTLIRALFFVFATGPITAQIPSIRTDGYYYWHNGVNKIVPFITSGRITVTDMVVQLAFQHGVELAEVKDRGYQGIGDCIPPNVIFTTRGSTYTHYVRFFNDKEGVCEMSPCLNVSAVDAVNKVFDDVAKGREDVGQTITTLSLGQKGEIYFEIYKPPALKETFNGKVLANGLELYVEYPDIPNDFRALPYMKITRHYKFYKFGTYPSFDK